MRKRREREREDVSDVLWWGMVLRDRTIVVHKHKGRKKRERESERTNHVEYYKTRTRDLTLDLYLKIQTEDHRKEFFAAWNTLPTF